ncbi:helix-turn-helix protein [Actinocorallia herbida]|uniref:Helix-turn-helix protein n=1 Tax=Actinocorallia herbida TaxID=58109 RepID=A0A3N1CUR1_9ACTN|nr:helix-turn-helix transcriptional regulator [Actinocorallia herbida]ROO85036.1 helix-turn-helix protein [Actinocorallia herbida]
MPVIVRDPLDPRISHWHWLAQQMRWWRERHNLSLAQVGQLLGIARSTVSNLEAGRRRLDLDYAKILDDRYGTGSLLQTLTFYARMGHDPDWHRTFLEYERVATMYRIYNGQRVPIPLQTESTMRALMAAARTVQDPEAVIEARIARQQAILDRPDPPYVWVLLDEPVLDSPTGGRAVLRDQLAHLVELGSRPNIVIRVISSRTGAHNGSDGPIQLVSLSEREIAYVGAQRGGRLIESPGEVREVGLDWDFIGHKAMSMEESRSLILAKMEALS